MSSIDTRYVLSGGRKPSQQTLDYMEEEGYVQLVTVDMTNIFPEMKEGGTITFFAKAVEQEAELMGRWS